MATTSALQFYCHKCRHKWRKTDDSDFVCPQCQDGFIEEIPNATVSLSRERITDAGSVSSYLTRLMEQVSPSEGPSTRYRARSRSPRVPLNAFPSLRLSITRLPNSPQNQTTSSSDLSPSNTRAPSTRSASPPRYRRSSRLASSSRQVRLSNMSSPTSSDFEESHESPPRPRRAHLEPPFNLGDIMGQFLYSYPLPVSQNRLDTLPVTVITEEHLQTPCSICFDEFKVCDNSVRRLSCNHMFHELCIFPWLRINGTCPVCRAPLDASPNASHVLSPETLRQRNFDSLVRFIRLRNDQRNQTENTRAAAENSRSGVAIRSGMPNPNAASDFLERRRRFRLASGLGPSRADLETARSLERNQLAVTQRAFGRAGRLELALSNHIRDRAFFASEMANFRGQPTSRSSARTIATVDLTNDTEQPSQTASLPPVTIEEIQFAGLSPFNFETTSESSMSSDSETAWFDSDEEVIAPINLESPLPSPIRQSQEVASNQPSNSPRALESSPRSFASTSNNEE